MNDERQKKIADIFWHRSAKAKRDAMKIDLAPIFDDYEFLNQPVSQAFGQSYWREANRCSYDEAQDLEKVLARLNDTDRFVLWIHRHSDEAGALKVRLGLLLKEHAALRVKYGPDLLFADEELSFGVCFEDAEDRTYLRWWHE